MTLIASTFSEELPFLLGDLLFSSKESKIEFITPTQIRTYSIPGDNLGLKPFELCQKIYILSENLAIAFAGDKFEMRTLLCELKTRISYFENISKEILEEFLKEFDLKANFSNSALLMLLVLPQSEENRSVSRFSYGEWSIIKDDHFGSIWAIGSGAEKFLDDFKTPISYTSDSPRETFNYALAANLGLLAKWLAIEKGSGKTISDNWGSGFEMISFDGNKFTKFQNLCFIVFEGRSDEQDVTKFVTPTVVIYHHYENEILHITSLNLGESSCIKNDLNITYKIDKIDLSLFIVKPIDIFEELEVDTQKDFSFETNTIAVGYSILIHNKGMYNPSFYLLDESFNVRYKQGEFIEINVPTEFNHSILLGAKSAYDLI